MFFGIRKLFLYNLLFFFQELLFILFLFLEKPLGLHFDSFDRVHGGALRILFQKIVGPLKCKLLLFHSPQLFELLVWRQLKVHGVVVDVYDATSSVGYRVNIRELILSALFLRNRSLSVTIFDFRLDVFYG